MRLPDFSAVDFDLSRMAMPWLFFWTLNVSLSAADFWRVGGFDEDFTGWGGEHVELGYRLHEHGVPLTVSRESWGIEAPHERSHEANVSSFLRNCDLFIRKHPSLLPELYWAVTARGIYGSVETERRRFEGWAGPGARATGPGQGGVGSGHPAAAGAHPAGRGVRKWHGGVSRRAAEGCRTLPVRLRRGGARAGGGPRR
ncbi:glycosyltransferase family 2 protein [Streptomyces flavidovirens]